MAKFGDATWQNVEVPREGIRGHGATWQNHGCHVVECGVRMPCGRILGNSFGEGVHVVEDGDATWQNQEVLRGRIWGPLGPHSLYFARCT